MRLTLALTTSAVLHLGLLGGLWLWRESIRPSEFQVLSSGPAAPAQSAERSLDDAIEFAPPEPAAQPPSPAPESTLVSVPLEVARADAELPELTIVEPPPVALRPAIADRLPRPRAREESVAILPSEAVHPPRRRSTRPPDLRPEAVLAPVSRAAVAGAQVDQLPRKLPSNAPPHYPPDVLQAGGEGRVLILALIGADGLVDRASVATTSGWPSLDQAALEAVRLWRFAPARRWGAAVDHEAIVPVTFSIRGG